MEQTPNTLPEMRKSEEIEPNKFNESSSKTSSDKVRVVWIIVLAFLLLASFGVIVWLIFSGRSDQKLHGDNLSAFTHKQEKDQSSEISDVDPGVIVNDAEINLTDYDSNITITTSGEHTLTGILNYSVLVNSDGPVTLKLKGITISATETSAIANRSDHPLNIILLENTTNALTDGGQSIYDGALFSNGDLTISAEGIDKTLGSLIISGRQSGGEGIATKNANLNIESGKIMVTSEDDGLNTGGENGGTITIKSGVLWIRAGGDGIDSNKNISIDGGNILVMNTSSDNAALDANDGIVINGGNVVALGSGMLEAPLETSPQKFLSLELNSTVKAGSTVYVKNTDTNIIVNFKTESDFKTLIFSTNNLAAGNYEISVDGQVLATGVIK